MEDEYRKEDLFLGRLENSNAFTNEEKNIIMTNNMLYKKCYFLGILDALNK